MKQNTIDDFLNNKETYDGEVGKVKSGPGKILYLLGTKKMKIYFSVFLLFFIIECTARFN